MRGDFPPPPHGAEDEEVKEINSDIHIQSLGLAVLTVI